MRVFMNREKKFKGYILKGYWKRTPDTRDNYFVDVIPESENDILFTEQTNISVEARKKAENLIKDYLPENVSLGSLIEKYTLAKVEERIESREYEEGRVYPPMEIRTWNIESWLSEVRKMYSK